MNVRKISLILKASPEPTQTELGLRDTRSFFHKYSDSTQMLLTSEFGDELGRALQAAVGDPIVIMELSLSIPLAEVVAVLAYFAQNPECQLVIGNRFGARKGPSRLRPTLWHKFIQALISTRYQMSLADPTCPFVGLSRSMGEALSRDLKQFTDLWPLEIVLQAHKRGVPLHTLAVQTTQAPPKASWGARIKSIPNLLRI